MTYNTIRVLVGFSVGHPAVSPMGVCLRTCVVLVSLWFSYLGECCPLLLYINVYNNNMSKAILLRIRYTTVNRYRDRFVRANRYYRNRFVRVNRHPHQICFFNTSECTLWIRAYCLLMYSERLVTGHTPPRARALLGETISSRLRRNMMYSFRIVESIESSSSLRLTGSPLPFGGLRAKISIEQKWRLERWTRQKARSGRWYKGW